MSGPFLDVSTSMATAYAALAGLTAFMVAAALYDVRQRRIPNVLTATCAVAGLGASWLLGGEAAALAALAAGAGALAVGYALFAMGVFGGGDGKLIAATAIWVGPDGALTLALLTALFGGALAIYMLAAMRAPALQGVLGKVWREQLRSSRPETPYALAIAPAAVVVFALQLAAHT